MGALSVMAMLTLAAEPKLACTSFTCSAEIAPAVCEAYERRFTDRLSRSKEVLVTTQRDVQAVIGLERQRQLLGCSAEEGASCVTELAGALGVDGIMTGVITRTRSGYLLSIKVVNAKDGRQWVTASERARTEGEVQDALDFIAKRFVYELNGRQAPRFFRPVMLGVTGLGVGLTVVGAVLYSMSKSQEALLRSDTPQTPLEIQATASSGSTLQTAGGLLMGVGIPITLTALLLALVDPTSDGMAVVPMVGRNGAYVSVGWAW